LTAGREQRNRHTAPLSRQNPISKFFTTSQWN